MGRKIMENKTLEKGASLTDLPYYSRLVEVRKYFEENIPNFEPYGNCHPASRLISQVTPLKQVAGDFILGNTRADHGWNYDPERQLYLDVTHDQFGSPQPIIAVPSTDPRYCISGVRSFFERLGLIDSLTGESSLRLQSFLKWRMKK
ncbi:Uncharacterised protein [uncultured archaeon]|nr:Uncharacterised protein [uncultured archaeon]